MIITQEYRRAFAEEYQAIRAYKRERLLLDRMRREQWPDEQVKEQYEKTGAAHLRLNQAHEDYMDASEKQRELNATTAESDISAARGRTV